MNVRMDDLEVKLKRDMKNLKDDLKAYVEEMMNANMEGLKEGLEKFLEERLSSGDNVINENHDEDKRDMNYDCRDSNVWLKNNQILNINMRNFASKDPVTWLLYMEQYFDLHYVQHT